MGLKYFVIHTIIANTLKKGWIPAVLKFVMIHALIRKFDCIFVHTANNSIVVKWYVQRLFTYRI
jgi:hypothetical protein